MASGRGSGEDGWRAEGGEGGVSEEFRRWVWPGLRWVRRSGGTGPHTVTADGRAV